MYWGDTILEQFIWLLWDLLAVLIFATCVYRCVSRGFVSTIIGFLVYIAATVSAAMFNKQIAQFLYDNVIYDAVRHSLTRSFNAMLSQTGESPKSILEAIPFALRVIIGSKSGEVAALPLNAEDTLNAADTLSANIIDIALKDPLITILHAAGFLLLFAVATLIMRRLARLFTGVNRIPVIGAINSILGGIVGVLEGVVSLYFSAFILRLLVAFSGGARWWLNAAVMESTYIWQHFY